MTGIKLPDLLLPRTAAHIAKMPWAPHTYIVDRHHKLSIRFYPLPIVLELCWISIKYHHIMFTLHPNKNKPLQLSPKVFFTHVFSFSRIPTKKQANQLKKKQLYFSPIPNVTKKNMLPPLLLAPSPDLPFWALPNFQSPSAITLTSIFSPTAEESESPWNAMKSHLSKLPGNKKCSTFLGNQFMYCPKVQKVRFWISEMKSWLFVFL